MLAYLHHDDETASMATIITTPSRLGAQTENGGKHAEHLQQWWTSAMLCGEQAQDLPGINLCLLPTLVLA